MRLEQILARNLRHPRGFIGKLVGKRMNKGNDFMNRFAIKHVAIQSDDHILEIGFGNGKYLSEAAKLAPSGFVAGVDYSVTMVKHAIKRNTNLIQQGLVDIKIGVVDSIPYDDDSFHKVFTVNTIYFWPNPDSGLNEIYRVMKPEGKLIIAFRSKEKMQQMNMTKYGFTLYDPNEVVELVKHAGFSNIALESSPDQALDVNCIVATK